MISWVIWNARNKPHFEKTQVPPKVILDGPVGFLEEYQKLMIAQGVAQAFFFPCFVFGLGYAWAFYMCTLSSILIFNIYYLNQKKKKNPFGIITCLAKLA